eukprot:10867003-Heterocapsa_arctica.AAC.1
MKPLAGNPHACLSLGAPSTPMVRRYTPGTCPSVGRPLVFGLADSTSLTSRVRPWESSNGVQSRTACHCLCGGTLCGRHQHCG